MSRPDYAIVAGISHYPAPGLGTLDGTENDARAFHQWVTTKGGVDASRATLILSSQYTPLATDPIDALPDEGVIERAFRRLQDASETQAKQRLGPTIGRRLYIFLAGHGFVPQWKERLLALLTANAAETNPTHVAAPLYQRWARDAGIFEEVLLFMDCCATTGREVELRRHTFVTPKDVIATNSGRLFYAAACKPGFKTREKTVTVAGQVRGAFSVCLLDALSGLAAEDGKITNDSLAKYLTEQMKTHLEPRDLDDDEIAKTADVDFDPKGRTFVLFEGFHDQATRRDVTLRFRPSDVGSDFVVWFGLEPVLEAKVPADAIIQLRQRIGMYVVRVDGREKTYEVPKDTDVDP
jgi:Caspase domain